MNRPYEIVMATDIGQLAAAVNQLIEQGYEPCGGMMAGKAQAPLAPHPHTIFMQTLYRRIRITLPIADVKREPVEKTNGEP